MKKNLLLFFILLAGRNANSQLCPGGGTTFASAVAFNQSWIAGCLTGTSCNGGTEFDNRAVCEPTTAIDACGASPSCSSTTNGSDIWFYFYATTSTATISVIQNVSFIVSVQAFSGSTCVGLTEIGCVLSSGPSTGALLNLNGLISGQKYYFRISGSANVSAQRTGTYCFCGSTNLGSLPLPLVNGNINAQYNNGIVALSWESYNDNINQRYEVQRSTDGLVYNVIGYSDMVAGSNSRVLHSFNDIKPSKGINYYRLRFENGDRTSSYSDVVKILCNPNSDLTVTGNASNGTLILESNINCEIQMVNIMGQPVLTQKIVEGHNQLATGKLSSGIYIIRNNINKQVIKLRL